MKRFLPVLGALVLVAGVIAVVAWQRSGPPPRSGPSGDVVLQYSDGTQLWRQGEPDTPVVRQVFKELGDVAMLSLDQLRKSGGAIVVTTLDRKAQAGAETAIREAAAPQPASLRYSISVAVFVGSDVPATPAVDSKGKQVTGAGLPNQLWRAFEDKRTQW